MKQAIAQSAVQMQAQPASGSAVVGILKAGQVAKCGDLIGQPPYQWLKVNEINGVPIVFTAYIRAWWYVTVTDIANPNDRIGDVEVKFINDYLYIDGKFIQRILPDEAVTLKIQDAGWITKG